MKELRCPASATLISPLQVCDGTEDCLDGYDEASCTGLLKLPGQGFGGGSISLQCAIQDVNMSIRNGLISVPAFELEVNGRNYTCESGSGFVYNWTAFEIIYESAMLQCVQAIQLAAHPLSRVSPLSPVSPRSVLCLPAQSCVSPLSLVSPPLSLVSPRSVLCLFLGLSSRTPKPLMNTCLWHERPSSDEGPACSKPLRRLSLRKGS